MCIIFSVNCCPELLSRPFIGLETKTETLAIRSRDHEISVTTEPEPTTWVFTGLETKAETWTKLTRVHSSLETMVSRSQHFCITVFNSYTS